MQLQQVDRNKVFCNVNSHDSNAQQLNDVILWDSESLVLPFGSFYIWVKNTGVTIGYVPLTFGFLNIIFVAWVRAMEMGSSH